MPLRPRYSLLTLLILTALVAGGVKLWYGPHWRTLSTPPTGHEAALFDKYSEVPRFDLLSPVITEYQYRNTCNGQELLLIKGTPTPDKDWYVTRWRTKLPGEEDPKTDAAEREFWSTGTTVIVPAKNLNENAPVVSRISCWYAPSRLLYVGDQTPAEMNGIQLPPRWLFPTCYFVSEGGQVYKYLQSYGIIFVVQISVSEIAEPELHALIEQELAHLPEVEAAR